MVVVAEAADGKQALAVCRDVEPDVVLMDVRMPVMNELDATRALVCAGSSPGPDADHLRLGRLRIRGDPSRRQRVPAQGRTTRRPRALGASGCSWRHHARAGHHPAAGGGVRVPPGPRHHPLRGGQLDRARARGPHTDGTWTLQRRNRRPAVPIRDHREDTRHPHPRSASATASKLSSSPTKPGSYAPEHDRAFRHHHMGRPPEPRFPHPLLRWPSASFSSPHESLCRAPSRRETEGRGGRWAISVTPGRVLAAWSGVPPSATRASVSSRWQPAAARRKVGRA